MRCRSASLLLRGLLSLRLSARDTVIFDTPTRAATSAMVTAAVAGAAATRLGAAAGGVGGGSLRPGTHK